MAHEAGIDAALACATGRRGAGLAALRQQGLDEGISTRMLIYAGILIRDGVPARNSCEMTLTRALTDDRIWWSRCASSWMPTSPEPR